MAIPVPPNTTCDIYRAGRTPVSGAPDVPGVPVYFYPRGASSLTTPYYTHKMLVAIGVDIRDDNGGFDAPATNVDNLYIPDKTGVHYQVILIRRIGRGTPWDHKEVLVKRGPETVTFPTDNL